MTDDHKTLDAYKTLLLGQLQELDALFHEKMAVARNDPFHRYKAINVALRTQSLCKTTVDALQRMERTAKPDRKS